jgi:N-acetylneuraminic acid mutarotase
MEEYLMRKWHLIPLLLILLVIVGLPVAAFTDTGVEKDFRKALGISDGECEPMTNLASDWTSEPDLPSVIDEPRGVAIDGKIYLVGGIEGLQQLESGRLLLDPSDELTEYDPKTEAFKSLTPMPRRANHIGVVTYDGDLYVVGGYGRTLDHHTSRAFLRYDPDSDHWSRMPDLPVGRAAMAAGVVGHQLIVAGGALDNDPQSTTFDYDFDTGKWGRMASMGSKREHVGATVLGDDLYVLGGRETNNLASRTAEVFDAKEDRWAELPPMPVGAGGLGAVTVDNDVIAVGGGNDAAGTVTGAVQEWNPATGEWSLIANGMRTPRHGHATTAWGDKIWVFGGSPCAYYNATDSVESVKLDGSGEAVPPPQS